MTLQLIVLLSDPDCTPSQTSPDQSYLLLQKAARSCSSYLCLRYVHYVIFSLINSPPAAWHQCTSTVYWSINGPISIFDLLTHVLGLCCVVLFQFALSSLIIFISSFPQLQPDDWILCVVFHHSHGRYVRFSHLLLFWGKCRKFWKVIHIIYQFIKLLSDRWMNPHSGKKTVSHNNTP